MAALSDTVPEHGSMTILAAVCLAALVLPLSFSGGAVATPAIGRDLGGSPVVLNWITNAFMLTFGSFLMAAGSLADQFGRKRVFTRGLAAFVITSLALGLAPSVVVLDALRALQGLAAAAALAGGTAALAQEFDGHVRTRAFSLLGTTFGVGLAFGPVLAGSLIESFGWRAVFLLGAVIGTAALLFGVPRMRETRDPCAAGLDWPGTLTFTAALSLFTFGIIQAPASGWTSPLIIALHAAAAAMLVAFIIIETRTERPMLDLSLFRYSRFIGVQLLPIATCYCFVVLLVILPLRFIGIDGRSEIEAGLLMIALSGPMLVVPFLAALLARRINAGVLCSAGLLIASAGLIWLSHVTTSHGHAALPPMLLIGLGTGLPWGLMDGLSVSVVPKERAGMATGIFSTTRVAGEGVALAMVSAILSALIHAGLSERTAGTASSQAGQLAAAAQYLATGDLARASETLPMISRSALIDTYASALASLLDLSALVTALSALAVLGFLRQRRARLE